jgi:hypothetical protein
VENLVCPGTPDVNYIHGWIELKYVKNWPKRGGVLKLDHFTPTQKAWILRRRIAGGLVFVLLCVGNEWVLFSGLQAVKYLGISDRKTLIDNCLVFWQHLPTHEEFKKWISPSVLENNAFLPTCA